MWDFEVWRSPNIIVIVCPNAMIIYRDIHKLATCSAFYPIKMCLHTSRMFSVQRYWHNSRAVTWIQESDWQKNAEFATNRHASKTSYNYNIIIKHCKLYKTYTDLYHICFWADQKVKTFVCFQDFTNWPHVFL